MNLCSGGRKDRSNIFSGIIYPDFRYEKNIFLCVCLYHWVEQRLNKTANKRRVSFFFQYSAGRISQELQHKDVIFWDWCGLPNEGLAGHWLNTNQKIFFSWCLKVTSQSAWTTSSFMFHTYIQEGKKPGIFVRIWNFILARLILATCQTKATLVSQGGIWKRRLHS